MHNEFSLSFRFQMILLKGIQKSTNNSRLLINLLLYLFIFKYDKNFNLNSHTHIFFKIPEIEPTSS